jgi:DegV family protein with EDD domain
MVQERMPPTSLISDSSACLLPEAARRFGISVLPIVIHLPSGDIRDGMQEAGAVVYLSLARGESVKSSAPTTLEYLAAMEGTEGDPVVVTPAAEFTAMYRNAAVAAEISARPVAVVDSRTAAAAHGLVVLAAAEVAAAGGGTEAVVRAAEDAGRRAELVAALADVEHLKRSGRVPSVALDLARQLGIRPVFRLNGGAVERLGVPRSAPAALRRIRREAMARGLDRAGVRVVFHAANPDGAEELRELVGGSDYVTEFSPSMGIHTGPGVVGVAWLRPASPDR